MTISKIFIYPIVLIITLPLCIILLPWLITDAIKSMKEKRNDPEGYKVRQKEAKRLSKNRTLINYLKYNKVYLNADEEAFFEEVDRLIPEESVILTVEQAGQRLNRLPIKGDHFFLLGISYDRETYLLVPRPHTPYTVQTPNTFIGEKWNFFATRLEYDYFGTKLSRPTYGIMWALTKFERACEYPKLPERAEFNPKKHKMHEYDMDMFEFIIDPRKHYDIMSELKEYLNYCHYQHYIEEQQDLYFKNKKKLLEKMDKAESREEFMMYADELKEFNASNEDVVKMIWEGNQNKIKG